jgi:hypothetical protein
MQPALSRCPPALSWRGIPNPSLSSNLEKVESKSEADSTINDQQGNMVSPGYARTLRRGGSVSLAHMRALLTTNREKGCHGVTNFPKSLQFNTITVTPPPEKGCHWRVSWCHGWALGGTYSQEEQERTETNKKNEQEQTKQRQTRATGRGTRRHLVARVTPPGAEQTADDEKTMDFFVQVPGLPARRRPRARARHPVNAVLTFHGPGQS